MPRFIRKHPIWFALLALLLAYGLWWLYQDYELHTYPQQVANNVPIPPEVKLVDTDSGYDRNCKGSSIVQYYSTNHSWEDIVTYYQTHLQKDWQTSENGILFYQFYGSYNRLAFIVNRIELTNENKPRDPLIKQLEFKSTLAYLIQISYNQDIRTYGAGGACKPED